MNTSSLIITLILLSILILISFLSRLLLYNNNKTHGEYYAKSYLLTKAEQIFFKELLRNINDNFYIATKVNLADVVRPKKRKILVF